MKKHLLQGAVMVTGAVLCGFFATSAWAQVRYADLEERDGLLYRDGSETPYSGPIVDPGELTGRVSNGLRDGEWLWTYPSGEPDHRMVYASGEITLSEGWHRNGQLELRWEYRDGVPHGTSRSWDRHGTLRQERAWANGRPEGTYRLWDHNGGVLYTAEYRDGALDGAVVWWYPSGQKRWETAYSQGKRAGTWTQYAPDGRVQMQSEWSAGELLSRITNPHARH